MSQKQDKALNPKPVAKPTPSKGPTEPDKPKSFVTSANESGVFSSKVKTTRELYMEKGDD